METTTTANSHFRTLHYVEVLYFIKGQYDKRNFKHYPEDEAKKIYQRTINKAKQDKLTVMICLREENHNLLEHVKTF